MEGHLLKVRMIVESIPDLDLVRKLVIACTEEIYNNLSINCGTNECAKWSTN